MESQYIVVFNDKKRGEASASLLCEMINQGALIISNVATRDSVHYLIAKVNNNPQNDEVMHHDLTDEDAAIIRDNLDATHEDKR